MFGLSLAENDFQKFHQFWFPHAAPLEDVKRSMSLAVACLAGDFARVRGLLDDDHASVFIVRRRDILAASLPDYLDDFTLREYVLLAMHKAKPESKRKKIWSRFYI